ncbi:hypothetical protein Hanom_Chr17g01565621 [Helianthus anomalus]
MDFNPKHDSVHIPPDPPLDLGFEPLTKGSAMGSKVCARAVEVSAAAESGIICSVVLAESDVVFLGRVLGDNWKSRVADTDLEGINAGCSVNLLIEGLGKRSCPVELFSGQYGSVLDVLASLAKQKGSDDEGMGCNSGNDFDMKELSSRWTFRNEGLQVKASKVMWDNNSYIKMPLEGSTACKDEDLPDGICAIEIMDNLAKMGCKGMCRDKVLRSNKKGGFNDNARMFSFSVAALNFAYNPGSLNGKVAGVGVVFEGSVGKSKECMGDAFKKVGVENPEIKVKGKKMSMKKLIQEKSEEMSPYRISKVDMPFINSLEPVKNLFLNNVKLKNNVVFTATRNEVKNVDKGKDSVSYVETVGKPETVMTEKLLL